MATLPDRKARDAADRTAGDVNRVEADARAALSSGYVVVGKVVRAGVGSYDFAVKTGDGSILHCTVMSRSSYAPFGYSESFVPVEGSTVVVAAGTDCTGTGYIIGTVPGAPDMDDASEDESNSDSVNVPKQGYTYPYGPSMSSEAVYKDLLDDDGSESTYQGSFRPADVFPGEYVVMNEHGVGIDGDMLTMSIRGGNATVAASAIDDTVKIACRGFKYYGVDGYSTVFTDAGCITKESRFAEYLGERTGSYGLKRFVDKVEEASDASDESGDNQEDTEKNEEKKPLTGKYRLRTFLGYLGSIFSVFLSKPEKNNEANDDEQLRIDNKEPKNEGLLQLNVNDNGRVMFRSAGGFVLERSDRIPVPTRINDPESPGGVKADEIEKKDELKFEIPEDDEGNKSPHYMPLALADKMAFDYRRTYDRFIEHIPSMQDDSGDGNSGGDSSSDGESGDDFYLRNEQDLDPLTSDAGIPDRKVTPDDLNGATGRKAGVYVLPTGEIILRDAWGSEIIMAGGVITFNTPGTVRLNPGRSVIVQAGDDIVLKARHSIDVDASENDITIKGDRNVRIAAGSDQTPDAGGIVIESFATSSSLDVEDKDGEDSTTTGIVLKANNSFVSMLGARTIIGAEEEVRIATGKGEDTREGQLNLAVGSVGVLATEGVLISSGDAGISVAADNVSIIGNSTVIGGSSGVMFAKDGQIGVPIWVDMTSDFISTYIKRFQEYAKDAKKDELNKPIVLHEMLDTPLFSYRTSEQCNTVTGIELTDPPDHFTEYQPYWSVLAKMKVGTLSEVELEAWEPHTIDNKYPWPGTDAYTDGKYAILDEEQATDEETYNLMKLSIEKKSDDSDDKSGGQNNDTEQIDIVCSKDFKDIEGDEESENKMLIKLEGLDKYIVPAIPEPEDGEEDDETK